MPDLEITPKLRRDLGKPLGILFQGDFEATAQQAIKAIEEKKPPLIMTVGDVVTANLINAGVHVDIFIIDDKTLRDKRKKYVSIQGEHRFEIENPAGLIKEKNIEILKRAFDIALNEHKIVEIFVSEGEEDLLGIPAVVLAPEGTLIFYGQPEVLEWPSGMVMVEVSPVKQKEFQGYLDEMKKV
ncbi:MAG: DUF359 domain-containing protein [Candidatus Helarchaeota archaeon]